MNEEKKNGMISTWKKRKGKTLKSVDGGTNNWDEREGTWNGSAGKKGEEK